MNDDGYPHAKIPRHQFYTYNIGTQITREKETTEQMSMLNADKMKTHYYKAITKYDKFLKSTIPRLHVYKYSTGSHLKSTEDHLGLSTMISNFAMFLLEDNQDNR